MYFDWNFAWLVRVRHYKYFFTYANIRQTGFSLCSVNKGNIKNIKLRRVGVKREPYKKTFVHSLANTWTTYGIVTLSVNNIFYFFFTIIDWHYLARCAYSLRWVPTKAARRHRRYTGNTTRIILYKYNIMYVLYVHMLATLGTNDGQKVWKVKAFI